MRTPSSSRSRRRTGRWRCRSSGGGSGSRARSLRSSRIGPSTTSTHRWRGLAGRRCPRRTRGIWSWRPSRASSRWRTRPVGFFTWRRSKLPEVIMPKMGDAMEEGTLVKWLKSEGDEVSEGDPIAEIETDKVTLELEAENAGTLAQLIASEGQDIPVGDAIAFIAGEGEEVPERNGGSEAQAGGEAEEGG